MTLPASDPLIADTSGLILLDKIEEVPLLHKTYGNVLVTAKIQNEFGRGLPDWIEIRDPTKRQYEQILEMDLDSGEASAIALAIETRSSALLMDDLKGRKAAEKLSLRYTGSLGLILRAKQEGVIDSVRPIIDRIRSTDFRFSEKLLQTIIDEARE